MELVKTYLIIASFLTFFGVRSENEATEETAKGAESTFTCPVDAVVSVRRRTASDEVSDHICTGILITAFWVLTTAKDIKKYIPARLGIAAGDEIAFLIEKYNGLTNEVERIELHPLYSENPLKNNLGMLRVIDPIISVLPAILPREKITEDLVKICKSDATAYRWLNANYDLKCEQVTVINFEDCNKSYVAAGKPALDEKELACIKDTSKDLWPGDKGTPLLCDDIYYAFISFKEKDLPAVYTRIDRHLEFIEDIVEEEASFKASKATKMCFNSFWLLILFITIIYN